MIARFWGTRGSIPVALTTPSLQAKLVTALVKAAGRRLETPDQARAFVERELDLEVSHTFGGHSACVELDAGDGAYTLCDVGSGAAAFGNRVLATRGPKGHTFHVLVSHLHWDHIMGFPFFLPAYLPGNRVRIYGCHDTLEEGFRRQNAPPSFPIDFSRMEADVDFVRLVPGREYGIGGFRVRAIHQRHAGDSYGYRLERDGTVIVYSTDAEHAPDDPAETAAYVDFFRDADLVIFDGMYSLADAVSVKERWGHSSNIVGVELCQMARARHVCLYHHDPTFGDDRIAGMLRETRRFEEITREDHRVEVSAAWDGMELAI